MKPLTDRLGARPLRKLSTADVRSALAGRQGRPSKALTVDQARAGELWQDSGLVFTTTIGTDLDQHNVRRQFRQITKAAGLGVG